MNTPPITPFDPTPCIPADLGPRTGIELITEERARQIREEGWTTEHDDQHKDGQLAEAAACYARHAADTDYHKSQGVPIEWPWHHSWWKPNYVTPIGTLVKAGALIAAEIDRLQRLAAIRP